MSEDLKVSSYVTIREGCPVRYRVNGTDDVEFTFGGKREPFELVLDPNVLRTFLKLGSDALEEIFS